MDQRAEGQRTVDGAAGDDDIGPGRKRSGNGKGAGIGHEAVDLIRARHLLGHRGAIEHVAGVGADDGIAL